MENLSAGNVVVVDDDPLMLESVSVLLRSRGFSVRTFSGGSEALAGLQERAADLILADVNMPQMNGITMMERLRAVDPDTPVIFMTGNAEIDVAMSALRMKVFEFFLKPFNPILLIRSIELGVKQKQELLLEKRFREELERAVVTRSSELAWSVEHEKIMSAEIIERLAAAAELRDEATGQHIVRIGSYAGMIARGLGMPQEYCEMITRAGTMHDIGKIGIPDSILFKPAPLAPEQFEVIKTHTVIGAKILSGSSHPLLQMAASIALTHHERWDGSGYPHGLAGEEIPLAGRIVMIADQYDALRSLRVYKPPLDHATTCSIILRGDAVTRPDHFDPAILRVFAELEPHFAEAFARQGNQEPAPRKIAAPVARRGGGGTPERSASPSL